MIVILVKTVQKGTIITIRPRKRKERGGPGRDPVQETNDASHSAAEGASLSELLNTPANGRVRGSVIVKRKSGRASTDERRRNTPSSS